DAAEHVQVDDDEEERRAGGVRVADEPAPVDLAHDALHGVERIRRARVIEHREEDAGDELDHQHQQRQRAEEIPDIEILRRVVAGQLIGDELIDGQALVQPGPEASLFRDRRGTGRQRLARRAQLGVALGRSHQAPPLERTGPVAAIRHTLIGRLPNSRGRAALYTARGGHMLERLSRGLTFIAGSVVGGLALAFVIVAVRPDLIRGGAGSQQPPAPASAPAPVQSAPPASGPAHLTYAGAVQRAAPAVVNIYTAREVVERVDPSPLGELFGDVLPRYEKRYERSLGSGVIVDASGHIVTNYHVIANAGEIRVQLADGRIAQPQVVGADPDTDLAVLKVNLPNLQVITFGNSDDLRVGDIVLAIGDPLGLSQTVTHGIVSATARGHLGITTFEDFIQTD